MHLFVSRTVVAVVFLLLSGLVFCPSVAQAAVSRVTIQGNRFYSNGQPYFLTTNFLSATSSEPEKFTHTYFSDQVTDGQRSTMLNNMKSQGYNSIFLYTLNEGDYQNRRVTPYQDQLIGGNFNETKITGWRTQLQSMVNQDIRPIIWLFADDSGTIHSASTTEQKRYIQKMVQSFDDLPVMWVLALEADEYWSKAKTDELGVYLQSIAQNPVGVHQLPGRTDYMTSGWVDFGVYQYGFYKPWDQIYNDTLSKKGALNGKPFIAGEYDLNGGNTPLQQGLAAAFAGAAGATNGAPGGLDEFMATLPGNLTPSRNGNTLTLSGGGVTATAQIDSLQMSKNGQTTNTPTPTPTPTVTPTQTPTPTPTPAPASTLITNLTINDLGNAASWSIKTNAQEGDLQYGDRNYVLSNVPQQLQGADWISTANNSKIATINPVATFKVTKNSTVYVAVRQEIDATLPWLSTWTKTNLTLVNSEPKDFNVYAKNVAANETVNISPQAHNDYSYYTVFVKEGTENLNTPTPTPLPVDATCGSDINQDGVTDITDYSLLLSNFLKSNPTPPRSDINQDGLVDLSDYSLLVKNFLKPCSATSTPTPTPTATSTPTPTPTPTPTTNPSDISYVPVSQARYVVSPSGSDTNSGTAQQPFKTISKAAQVAQAGDVVVVKAGTYNEQVNVVNAGTAQNRIVFQSETKGAAVITGPTGGFKPANWQGNHGSPDDVGKHSNYVTLRGFTFRDAGNNNDHQTVKAATGWIVEDARFERVTFGVNIRGHQVIVRNTVFDTINGTDPHALVGVEAQGVQIQDVVIRNVNSTQSYKNIGASAITKFLYTDGLVVDNLLTENNYGPGLWFDWDNKNFIVRNSTFRNNKGITVAGEGGGFWIEGNPNANGKVYNNVFTGNQGEGIQIMESNGVEVYDNTFLNNYACIKIRNQGRYPNPEVRYIRNLSVHHNLCGGNVRAGIYTDEGDWIGWDYRNLNIDINNNYYRNDGKALIDWVRVNGSNISGVKYFTPAEVYANTGFEQNGQLVDQNFVLP